MSSLEVDRLLIYMPGLVGAFRLCKICKQYKSLNGFPWFGRICHRCRMPVETLVHARTFRTIALTDKGRAALRDMQSAA